MPALKCPHCGFCDLQVIDLEPGQPDRGASSSSRQTNNRELGCTRCGWSPSRVANAAEERDLALSGKPGKNKQ